MPCLRNVHRLARDVRADRLLAPHVVGLARGPAPTATAASKSVMSRYSLSSGRFASQPRPAADEMKPIAEPRVEVAARDELVDHVAVADEVDLLDVRRAVGHARAREQRVDRAGALVEGGVDRGLLAEVHVDRLRARKLDLREVHHHDLGAGVLHELGDGRAHAGGTADHEGPLAVVAKGAECTHVASPRSRRGAGSSSENSLVSSIAPATGPPPFATTATSGRRHRRPATWRSPASPRSCTTASWRKPKPWSRPGRELPAVRVERELAVERDPLAALDERSALAEAAEAEGLEPRHRQPAEAVVQLGDVDVGGARDRCATTCARRRRVPTSSSCRPTGPTRAGPAARCRPPRPARPDGRRRARARPPRHHDAVEPSAGTSQS